MCMYTHMYVCTQDELAESASVVKVSAYIHTYLCMCMYTHMYACMYVYTFTQREREQYTRIRTRSYADKQGCMQVSQTINGRKRRTAGKKTPQIAAVILLYCFPMYSVPPWRKIYSFEHGSCCGTQLLV